MNPQVFGTEHLIYIAASIVTALVVYLLLGAFLMFALDYSNPFYMVEPALDGTIFTVWGIAPIYIAAYGLILLIVELVRRRNTVSKSRQIQAE